MRVAEKTLSITREYGIDRRLADQVFQISTFGTLLAFLRHRRARLMVCRNATAKLRGKFDGVGRMVLGCRWPGGLFDRTLLLVHATATCRVDGYFKVFSGSRITVAPNASLRCGSGYLNTGVNVHCFHRIRIGEDVAIGENVQIRDDDSHCLDDRSTNYGPITIGDHVWIGMNSIILKNVTIGEGAVVAAGSVVTHDVAPNTLVAGTPAKFVREVSWHH